MLPVTLASVDVGSNAIRYLAVQLTAPGSFRTLEAERVPLRLGTDAFGPGRLSAGTLDAAVVALRSLRRRMDRLGVVHYRAVATSAVRESRNGAELADRAWREAGLRLEVIGGEEEAGLVWRAVRQRTDRSDRPWVLVDLGGGSLEVSVVRRDAVRWSRSETYGTVRLLAEIPSDEGAPRAVRAKLEPFLAELRRRLAAEDEAPAGLLAVGGNIEALAGIAGIEPAPSGGRVLPADTLAELVDRIAALPVDQRIDRLGLAPDRADVILPAAVVYQCLAELAGADRVHLPDAGLKEGVVLEIAERLEHTQRSSHRVAFLSDVHANALALRAALEVAEQEGAGRVVVAGDLVGDGPHPEAVLRMARGAGAECIRGNVDRKVLKQGTRRKRLQQRIEKRKGQARNRAWTALQLREADEDRSWLEALPPELRMRCNEVDVLVVHGTPRGDTDYLYSSLTPEGLAAKLEPVEGPRPRALVAGHSHVPFVRTVDDVLVINCGSAGRPADGDPRGSMVLADFADPDAPTARVLRFQYPVEALVHDLADSEVPGIDPEEYRLGVKR